jgi:hypothetical protein
MKPRYRGTTILLPAMDETYSLVQTVDTIVETVNSSDIAEIIFLLCDKTTEETRNTAEKLVKKYEGSLSVFIHDQTLPFVGGAIREGIDLAKGSHVIMMSTDLETDPYLVQTFIAYAKRYPNRIITASRWAAGGGFKGYNSVKLICNYLFEKMIAILFCTRLSDLTYAYRIFPTRLMKRIKWEELKHPFFLETALKPLRLGVKFIEVPTIWVARSEGESQNSFFANFKYFKTAWHNRWMMKKHIIL